MPEPDPAAAVLAEQLASLRLDVQRCQGAVAGLRARLDVDKDEAVGKNMVLLARVKRLGENVDGLSEAVERFGDALATALKKNRLNPPPAPYWVVSEVEGKAMLAELSEWVDGFARKHYPGYLARIPQCWPNHPEAVWELSTLSAEWGRIYADDENRDLASALWWHERWLPGTIARLAAVITCDESGCRRVRRLEQ